MEAYLRRVVHKHGLLIKGDEGLQKFSDACKDGKGPNSYTDLSQEICAEATKSTGFACILEKWAKEFDNEAFAVVANPKMGPGLTEPLNEDGYTAVSKLKSNEEMNVFIHRVVNHLGLEVKDRWGLLGLVPWFDGEDAKQSFAALTTEILGAAMKPDQWVAISKTNSSSLLALHQVVHSLKSS